MSACILCTKEALHCEENNPSLAFCDAQCQFIHYALIAGKRGRDEVEEEGVDFTEMLSHEVINMILLKFDNFEDLFNAARTNVALQNAFRDSRFRKLYMSDDERKDSFHKYRLKLTEKKVEGFPIIIPWLSGLPIDESFNIAITQNDIQFANITLTRSSGTTLPFWMKQEIARNLMKHSGIELFTLVQEALQISKGLLSDALPHAIGKNRVELVEVVIRDWIIDGDDTSIVDARLSSFIKLYDKKDVESLPMMRVALTYMSFNTKTQLLKYLFKLPLHETFYSIVNPDVAVILGSISGYGSPYHFHLANFDAIRKYLRPRHIETILAEISYFETDDDQLNKFKEIMDQSNLSRDAKFEIFERHITVTSLQYGKVQEILTWMVRQGHVNPKEDGNRLYHQGTPRVKAFLKSF